MAFATDQIHGSHSNHHHPTLHTMSDSKPSPPLFDALLAVANEILRQQLGDKAPVLLYRVSAKAPASWEPDRIRRIVSLMAEHEKLELLSYAALVAIYPSISVTPTVDKPGPPDPTQKATSPTMRYLEGDSGLSGSRLAVLTRMIIKAFIRVPSTEVRTLSEVQTLPAQPPIHHIVTTPSPSTPYAVPSSSHSTSSFTTPNPTSSGFAHSPPVNGATSTSHKQPPAPSLEKPINAPTHAAHNGSGSASSFTTPTPTSRSSAHAPQASCPTSHNEAPARRTAANPSLEKPIAPTIYAVPSSSYAASSFLTATPTFGGSARVPPANCAPRPPAAGSSSSWAKARPTFIGKRKSGEMEETGDKEGTPNPEELSEWREMREHGFQPPSSLDRAEDRAQAQKYQDVSKAKMLVRSSSERSVASSSSAKKKGKATTGKKAPTDNQTKDGGVPSTSRNPTNKKALTQAQAGTGKSANSARKNGAAVEKATTRKRANKKVLDVENISPPVPALLLTQSPKERTASSLPVGSGPIIGTSHSLYIVVMLLLNLRNSSRRVLIFVRGKPISCGVRKFFTAYLW